MPLLVLNQYRSGSSYKDLVGSVYPFPLRYRSRFASLPSSFVYYEPRDGGDQVYFGAGWVVSVNDDTEETDHFYPDLERYREGSPALLVHGGCQAVGGTAKEV
jgi:hypothetical protein